MNFWRILAAGCLSLFCLPALLPILETLARPQAWIAWGQADRLLALAGNTCALLFGVLLLVMPVGILTAILLYRTDLPLRRAWRFLVLLGLVVPLPLFTSAWQGALGTGGLLPLTLWTTPSAAAVPLAAGYGWKPWAMGLPAAIWVHAVAALPWVIVLVGQGLCWVERELEEDALTARHPMGVLWYVSLPRCRAAIFAAGLWVALMVVTEITVTDMMQVRTVAEEIYTQFVLGDEEALPRTLALALPAVAAIAVLITWASTRWEKGLPPLDVFTSQPRLFELGKSRLPLGLLCCIGVVILAGVPIASLCWKTGLGGSPQVFATDWAWVHVANAIKVRKSLIGANLSLACATGFATSAAALFICWLGLRSRWFRTLALILLALLWAMPGPILGLGLKQVIAHLMDLVPLHVVGVALYYGPSPLPAAWAHALRFLPFAVALLWPVVRLIPIDLIDAAQIDGASPLQEFRHVVLPLAWPAGVRGGIAVGVLSLGEIAASKLVETPGSQTFAHEVFSQMHYGVTNDLAALCLLLLAAVTLGAGIWAGAAGLIRAR